MTPPIPGTITMSFSRKRGILNILEAGMAEKRPGLALLPNPVSYYLR